MGKRSTFEDIGLGRDYYPTLDADAIVSLIPYIRGVKYGEPCAGEGHLVDHLMEIAICKYEGDIIKGRDALDLTHEDVVELDCFITNPPYSWKLLEPLLKHLPSLKPTWLLLPADFMHNKRSAIHMKHCSDIISVGRLYWTDNKVKGKDNYCWYCFHSNIQSHTRFHPRSDT